MPRQLVRALLAIVCSCGSLRAQTAPAPAPLQPQPFSLEEAIALALQKNFDLQLQANNVANAKNAVEIQDAAFDPTLTASATRSVNQAATVTSRLDDLDGVIREGPRNDSTQVRVGVADRITPTNGTISLNTNLSRQATNSSNALVNPSYGNGISANLNQPLLRDFGRLAATAQLERARLALNIANIAYRSRVLDVIRQTELAYYNLVTARETRRIRELTLAYNQKLLEENQARRATGVATDLDVLSAEVGVANARRNLLQAVQNVSDAEDNLLNLINVPSFDVQIGPVDFAEYRAGPPDFAASYRRAREYYPDTLSAAEVIKQLEIDLAVARRNLLPELDLNASLGYTARATDEGYEQAISNLPNDHGNNWSLGLSYTLPWGRRADKARYRTAQTNLASQKLRLEQLEQSLLVSVRAAVRAVKTQLAAVEIAAKGVELAERQYEQQKARFDAGLSTSRLVLLAQDDLENNRFQELSARVALRRGLAELHRLEGTSLERFRVEMPEPAQP